MGKLRKSMTAAIVTGLFFGGAGVAVADSWHELNLTTSGASFKGAWAWQSKKVVPSGLHVKGVLKDEKANDGHNVYLRLRVYSYPWGEIRGVQRKSVKVDKVLSDGAVLVTKEVRMHLCRDRGSLRPDNCTPLRLYKRK
ncbi:hypothetical protein SNE510_16670 [Streptomyces sp. NE5-10]|uniref:hypothetical protein n=1 Tax=Streptomyces sp. NE5-10 TaxID=2759674 RepID=UPI0019071494|nr:hypothetical protein [Streptomyces sp. NE5-10]GHJ92148.1 hypothetical protein SNE510_16670 [Streptomyces sp. NE5-10]